MGADFKRRNYFIKKGFQLRYTLTILLTLLVVMVVTGLGIYVGIWTSIAENFNEFKVSQDLETAKRIADYEGVRYKKGDYRLEKIFREAQLLSQQQREALEKALKAVNRSLLKKLPILIILIFLAGIFVSHKIAGPMYRFESSAAAVKEGNLKVRFKVRKGDAMIKTASTLEGMLVSLRGDFDKLKTSGEELKKEIEACGGALPAGDAAKIRETVKKIDEVLSKYKT